MFQTGIRVCIAESHSFRAICCFTNSGRGHIATGTLENFTSLPPYSVEETAFENDHILCHPKEDAGGFLIDRSNDCWCLFLRIFKLGKFLHESFSTTRWPWSIETTGQEIRGNRRSSAQRSDWTSLGNGHFTFICYRNIYSIDNIDSYVTNLKHGHANDCREAAAGSGWLLTRL